MASWIRIKPVCQCTAADTPEKARYGWCYERTVCSESNGVLAKVSIADTDFLFFLRKILRFPQGVRTFRRKIMANENTTEVAVSTNPQTEITESRPSQLFGPLAEVERLFDRLMPKSWIRPMAMNWPTWGGLESSLANIRVPQLDVIDRDKDILIRAELPGVEKKDIDVSISDNTLIIKGGVSRESKEQRKDYFRCEIEQGNFSRSVALPGAIDKAKISASLKDGILEVLLPKEESAQRRSVEVK
jgi:HSP20 family protein